MAHSGAPPSINAQFEECNSDDVFSTVEMVQAAHDNYRSDPKLFEKLLEDANKPLYLDWKKFTKLSSLVKLYNLKGRYG